MVCACVLKVRVRVCVYRLMRGVRLVSWCVGCECRVLVCACWCVRVVCVLVCACWCVRVVCVLVCACGVCVLCVCVGVCVWCLFVRVAR